MTTLSVNKLCILLQWTFTFRLTRILHLTNVILIKLAVHICSIYVSSNDKSTSIENAVHANPLTRELRHLEWRALTNIKTRHPRHDKAVPYEDEGYPCIWPNFSYHPFFVTSNLLIQLYFFYNRKILVMCTKKKRKWDIQNGVMGRDSFSWNKT